MIWKLKASFKKSEFWTSLVIQWLRIHLPMQGTQVQSLVWEDPKCQPTALKPVLRNKISHQNEKPEHHSKEQPHSPQLENALRQQ